MPTPISEGDCGSVLLTVCLAESLLQDIRALLKLLSRRWISASVPRMKSSLEIVISAE